MKYLLLLIFAISSIAQSTDYIEKDKLRWKPYYTDAKPEKTVTGWYLPFKVADRKKLSNIKVISIFGDHRDSYLKGHVHTAIDITEAHPASEFISVYPMANGVVCSIHLAENQRTVVVRHLLKDGSTMFTSYKHLSQVYVSTDDQVTENTKIARLFTAKETKKYGGNYDHLHLEIRKKFDDYGCASWLTMNKSELSTRFYNPLSFIKENVK